MLTRKSMEIGGWCGDTEVGEVEEEEEAVFGAQHRHSWRSAVRGSTRVARRAGMQQARKAAAKRRIATATKEMGSVGLTSKRKLLIKRVRAKEPASPTAMPMPASNIPSRRTRRRTSRDSAPRAMRTPISWVRCATVKEITP